LVRPAPETTHERIMMVLNAAGGRRIEKLYVQRVGSGLRGKKTGRDIVEPAPRHFIRQERCKA